MCYTNIKLLLEEMLAAYEERVDFIRELETVPDVAAAVKTAEFFNETLWKDDKRLRKGFSKRAFSEDYKFAKRIKLLLEEMLAAYEERVDFIRELETVPDVAAAVKTAEFLNETLWKDDKRIRKGFSKRAFC
ncbi:hypothetical protein Tco_0465861 [Tanacetum coccineum]